MKNLNVSNNFKITTESIKNYYENLIQEKLNKLIQLFFIYFFRTKNNIKSLFIFNN